VSSRVNVANPDLVMRHLARGRVWLAGAVLGTVVGGYFYWATPTTFTATSAVELSAVSPTIDLGATRGRPRLESVDTDARMLASDEVATAVAKASGDSAQWARNSVSVTARTLTRVLEISYTSATAKGASAGANTAADGLLAARQRLVVQPISDYLNEVAKRTATPLDAAVLNAADRSGPAEFRVESWRDRALAARLALPSSGTVLQRASGSSGPQRGDIEVPLTTGAALGALLALLLGMGVQWLRSGRARRARRIQLVVRHGGGLLKARTQPGMWTADVVPTIRVRRHPYVRGISWVVILSALGLALGYESATRLNASDLGRSTVLLRPLPGNAFANRTGDTAVDLKTDGQVALSDAVLGPVATAFHNGLTVPLLRRRISVKLVDNAEVVIISYQGDGAAQAIDVAQRVGEQFLVVRTARAKAVYKEQAALMEPQLTAAEDRAAAGISSASQRKGANGIAQTILNQRVVSLRSQLRTVTSDPPGPGTILATTSPRQTGIRKIQFAIVAFSWLIATSIGLLIATRKPRPRRRGRRGRPGLSSRAMTTGGEARAA
jgi:capsular polysaccharide biosynthesis protein